MSEENNNVNLELTSDEALVLFDFLARFDENGTLNIIDQSEERVLWNLFCILEHELSVPLKTDYKKFVRSARERLRDQKG